MRNLLGLFLVLMLLALCLTEEDAAAELEDRAAPKGCKRMNDWRKRPKFYKKGKLYFKDCKTYTCTEPKPRKFVWVDELDTKRCCSFNQTFYPISSKILCEQLPDDCTTVCLECVRVEAKANLDLVVDDNCPERPPETIVITEVPYDIKSPNYPHPYPPKQDICWSWTPKCGNYAYLEFFDFDVLGNDAHVTIKPPINGKSRYWGNSHNSENLPPKTIGFPCDTAVMICFHSGKIVNGHKGFSAKIVDKPCTDWISSPNYETVNKDYFTCDNEPPPHGYGTGIDHCDVRSPSSNGQTINLDFCQFDIHAPLEGDYLTIHPTPNPEIPKYYGISLDAPEAPIKSTEYPGVKYLSVCFKTRQTVDYHKGYLAEIYETGVSDFDIGQGSFDGAETCELIGLYILCELAKLNIDVGLYRDDGLAVTSATPRQVENLKKKISEVFRKNKLEVTIDANLKTVDFLDITMELENEIFKPFIKPNTVPLYINCESNHPPSVLRNIPDAINKRLSKISSNETVFNAAAPAYQEALAKSGHKYDLKFDPEAGNPPNKSRNRKRKICWFNPPFNLNTKTNIGREFLKLIDKSFPIGHPLRKICNRNTIKLSYRCTPSMSTVISARNAKLLAPPQNTAEKMCNCRDKTKCPLEGKCLLKSVVYKATVKQENKKTNTYIGLTSNEFKKRFYSHNHSFKNPDVNQTSLSNHIRNLKEANIKHTVHWEKIDQGKSFSPVTGICGLCTKEKFHITFKPGVGPLNKKSEMFSNCRHKRRVLLCGNSDQDLDQD